tara:strand:+ start:722 stop:1057 length:336 start_codon:yes stop_codon:yes gene_type:complete
MTKPKTARSFRTAILDDNAIISLNIKWLIQAIFALCALIYGWFQIETRISTLEKNLELANKEIAELVAKHIEEEKTRYIKMEETLKWYESELVKIGSVSINPLNWGKKKKR